MNPILHILLIAVQAAGALALVLDVVVVIMIMRGYELHARYDKDDDNKGCE